MKIKILFGFMQQKMRLVMELFLMISLKIRGKWRAQDIINLSHQTIMLSVMIILL